MASGTEPEPVVLGRIGNVVDCNDLNKTGIYYVINTSLNKPSDYAVLLHLNMQDDVRAQIAIGVNNKAMYYRRTVQSVWGPWCHVTATELT